MCVSNLTGKLFDYLILHLRASQTVSKIVMAKRSELLLWMRPPSHPPHASHLNCMFCFDYSCITLFQLVMRPGNYFTMNLWKNVDHLKIFGFFWFLDFSDFVQETWILLPLVTLRISLSSFGPTFAMKFFYWTTTPCFALCQKLGFWLSSFLQLIPMFNTLLHTPSVHFYLSASIFVKRNSSLKEKRDERVCTVPYSHMSWIGSYELWAIKIALLFK